MSRSDRLLAVLFWVMMIMALVSEYCNIKRALGFQTTHCTIIIKEKVR